LKILGALLSPEMGGDLEPLPEICALPEKSSSQDGLNVKDSAKNDDDKCKELKSKVIEETKKSKEKLAGKSPSYYKSKIKNGKMTEKMLKNINCSELKNKLTHLSDALTARNSVTEYIESAKTNKDKKCFGSDDKHKDKTAENELIESKNTINDLIKRKGGCP
jgi:hypothetical protein